MIEIILHRLERSRHNCIWYHVRIFMYLAVPSYQRRPSSQRKRERNVRFLHGVRRSARQTSRSIQGPSRSTTQSACSTTTRPVNTRSCEAATTIGRRLSASVWSQFVPTPVTLCISRPTRYLHLKTHAQCFLSCCYFARYETKCNMTISQFEKSKYWR